MFTEAYDASLSPRAFVDSMRRQHRLIMGIGESFVRAFLYFDFNFSAFPSFFKFFIYLIIWIHPACFSKGMQYTFTPSSHHFKISE